MKCLETRLRGDGMRYRRYELADGRRVTTVELPVSVLRGAAPPAKLKERIDAWQRGEAQRTRRAAVLKRLAEGVKPLAIAAEFGLSEREVQRIRKKMNQE